MAKSFDELAARTMTKAAIRRSDERARPIMGEMFLQQIRQALGLSQVEVANRLGMKQPSYSKLESTAHDMQISTLKRMVEAMGGSVDIVAHFPNGEARVANFFETKTSPRPNPKTSDKNRRAAKSRPVRAG